MPNSKEAPRGKMLRDSSTQATTREDQNVSPVSPHVVIGTTVEPLSVETGNQWKTWQDSSNQAATQATPVYTPQHTACDAGIDKAESEKLSGEFIFVPNDFHEQIILLKHA